MNLKIQVRVAESLPWSMRPTDIDNVDVLSFTIKIFRPTSFPENLQFTNN